MQPARILLRRGGLEGTVPELRFVVHEVRRVREHPVQPLVVVPHESPAFVEEWLYLLAARMALFNELMEEIPKENCFFS